MFKDHRGTLLPVTHSSLPFTPLRSFIVCNVPAGITRGGHAHHKTKQLAYVANGEIKFVLFDGECTKTKTLRAGEYAFIPEMVWDSQIFITAGAVLMVYCSTEYDKDDYITDMVEFLNLTKR